MEQSNEVTRKRQRGRSVVGPLILIAIGVLLLLNTMGVVQWSVWETLWRFWPAVLILIGLELVLGRGNPWLSVALVVLVLVLVIPLAMVGTFLPFGWTMTRASGTVSTQNVQVPLEGAREANVRVQFAAGSIYLGALGGDSPDLVAGEIRSVGGPVEIERGDEADRARANVTIRRQSGIPVFSSSNNADRWTLNLNRAVPLNLRVEGGAAEANLDLRQLMVRTLSLELGAASTRVQLPENAGLTQVTLRSGMAETRVTVPANVAARIHTRSGLATVDVDERRFPKRDGFYQSADWDTATNKVEISIEAGLTNVIVR